MQKFWNKSRVITAVAGAISIATSVAGVSAWAQADDVRRLPKPVRTYKELEKETGLSKPAALAYGRMAVDIAGKTWPHTVSFRCHAAGGHVESGLTAPPATKVFDNVYYVGSADVSTWAIDTPDGIILIDAQTTEDEARRYILDGLKSVGLDPARIRYVLVTHEHGDHYGGAALIKRLTGARIGMSEPAWQALARLPQSSKSPVPERDLTIADGEKLTLGDVTVTSVLTPGHTRGTLSFVFPVKAGGVRHMAGLWGGNGFPRGVPERKQFLEAIDHFALTTAAEKVDVELSIHGDTDNLIKRLADLRAGKPNSFLAGREAYLRFEEVYRLCSRARMAERGDFGG